MRVDLDLIGRLAGLAWPDAVASLLDAPIDAERVPNAAKSDDTVVWWNQKMTRPGSGIHERMTFLWHTLLTTHRYASGKQELVSVQLNMLRANALGNFRQLLQSFAVDGALIKYLDADSSRAKKPNENLAREMMELFTIGVGHYSEDDVRGAALAMTGWRVDPDNNNVYLDSKRANTEPVTFLGETKQWNVASIVDRLCDHPATARRVASLLWYHLVGTEMGAERAAEYGTWWHEQNLEIKPLVARMLNEEAFKANHYARPRSGYEFYAAAQSVVGFDPTKMWLIRMSGQSLYEPPNVGGWPIGDRWLTPDSMLRRSDTLWSFDNDEASLDMAATVDQMLDRCGLFVASEATLETIRNAGVGESLDDESIAELRWRIVMSSPEFQLT